jgi:tetratricopeptide (TPR) repeat protein
MKRFIIAFCFLGGSIWPAMGQHPLHSIIELVKQGELGTAHRLLAENLDAEPGDQESRLLLGSVMAANGELEAATIIWQQGLQDLPTDYPLLMHIGETHLQQANLAVATGQSTSMLPSSAEGHGQAQRRAYLRLAERAYHQAHALFPYQGEPASQLATIYEWLGEPAKALAQWEALAYAFPADETYAVSLGRCALLLGELAQAQQAFAQALAINLRHAPAYEGLADYWRARENAGEAQAAEQQYQFYTWLPDFCPIEYTEANFAAYQLLRNPVHPDQAARLGLVNQLINERSTASAEWLAALCWHHGEDDEVENALVAELANRGAKGARLLMEIAKKSSSDALVGKATVKLTERRVPGTLELLTSLLPRDRQNYFSMNIAYQLAVLGNDLAIPYLLRELHPDFSGEAGLDREFDPAQDAALQDARNRAALALAFFDAPIVMRHLERGLTDESVQQSCAAALYRLTMDERYLAELERRSQQVEDKNSDLATFCESLVLNPPWPWPIS